MDALIEKGIEVVTPVSEAPGGLSAEFLGPEGHALCFHQGDA